MTEWSLAGLLESVAAEVERNLAEARKLIAHEGEKGGASEEVWRSLFRRHLPLRYQVDTGFVVDSLGNFSEQTDIIIFDRQYSPLVFELGNRRIFPAEGIYAVFEAKQVASRANILAAKRKVSMVRRLVRTSLPIRQLDGKTFAKDVSNQPVLGGFLALESEWNPPLGQSLIAAAEPTDKNETLDLGCVAMHGVFETNGKIVDATPRKNAATGFLFNFIAKLQQLGTVPMIDMAAYARHLP